MKKYLSLILSAVMSLSAIAPTVVSAEGTAPSLDSIVVLGDSIASGYGLGENEHSYGEICADYFGAELSNFAKDGLDSYELLDMLNNLTDEQKESIKNTDVVVISTGGNDIMKYTIKQILDFAAKHDLLADGYTADDVPESPSASSMKMLDKKAFKEYVNSGILAQGALNTAIRVMSQNLRLFEGTNVYGQNKGIIHNEIMVNIDSMVKKIREINPDAEIIVQTVYQPLQLSREYVNKNYSIGYATMLTTLRDTMDDIMDTFRKELQQIEDIEIIDVLDTYTANGAVISSNSNPGHAYYFTNMQKPYNESGGEGSMDLHPNQKGHLAIASLLIGKIKVKDNETGELVQPASAERPVDETTGEEVPTVFNQVYYSIEDIADYPPLAMEKIVETIPDKVMPGDVDNDGFIDANDSTAILVEYASLSTKGETTLTEEENMKADANYDGAVDASDATIVSMYYAYLSTEHEGETLNIFGYMNSVQAEDNLK
ncbi:MAG: hypothetical protein K2K89_10985 [Ruminococcus sp.]|nr:hypothetical protein [Ruminococcus sp.]